MHTVHLQETFYIERAWSTILEHYEPIGEPAGACTAYAQHLRAAQEQHSCSHISPIALQSPWRIGDTHLNFQIAISACAQIDSFRCLGLP